MTLINDLWNNGKEDDWHTALANYWKYVKPTHFAIEKEFDSLNTNFVKELNSEEWYEFLLKKHFATVDQFAVKALLGVNSLPEIKSIQSMNPDQLKIKDAVILIEIMKHKAKELNNKFLTSFWTPRKIDMILWSIHR
ncbi:MAG: hypothetical protein WC854_00275 [Bacteroidales bacterium]